ncbi:hypothetical protein IJG10_01385 [Candidatus Saccharibacteria bacterium]|nr:hypothetical protein [Candidatus Saccharibacteria bacterium]
MIERVENPGKETINIARKFGELLSDRFKKDPNFYLFSPDETTSNRLDAVYEVESRAWALPTEDWDLPESKDGRIIELLSENALFATMVGALGNGNRAMMTSYESFFSVITSQLLQQLKFYVQLDAVPWRKPLPAVNLLSTSTCWRQDHNGFSHQSPALISTLLSVPSKKANCFFPIDDVSAEETFNRMLASENVVNLTTFDKNDLPRWIDSNHARFQFDNGGASIFSFASDENPEIVLTAAGDLATREMLAARELIKRDFPNLRLRFVGINALSYGKIGTVDKPLFKETFDAYFPVHCPIIASFHGYPDALRNILLNYLLPASAAEPRLEKLSVPGCEEVGSTTTPFEMLSLNHNSRFDLAADIARTANRPDLAEKYLNKIAENRDYARLFGKDKIVL